MSIGILLSVGLASAAIIGFQLVVMQLLAIAQWHHFGYMVISMALLGFGAAGTTLALAREFLTRHYDAALPLLYLAAGLSLAATNRLAGLAGDFDAFLLFFERRQLGLLVFSYVAYSLPFFFGGLAITLAFYRGVGQIGALYFANMAGSGVGAVLIIGLLWLLPATRLAGMLALLLLLAAWLVRPPRLGRRAAWALGLAALTVPIFSILLPAPPAPSEYKAIHAALQLPGARVVHRGWSPYGLLEVVRADAQRFAPSLSLRYRDEPPVRDVLFNNGEYYGTLLGRAAPDQAHLLDHTTRGLPYVVRTPASVLVLDAATGTDVSHALSHGVGRVVAVEPHRQLNELLQARHPEWIEGIYADPAVTLHGSSARTHLARSDGLRHDLVVLPVLGAFGGTTGVHALQEEYHLTLEGFLAIWAKLDDEGMIAVTAWQEEPPRATLKLVATWRRLLDQLEIADRAAHVAAIRSWGTTTFLLSKAPLTAVERARMREFSRLQGFDPLLLADLEPAEREQFNRTAGLGWFRDLDVLLHGDAEVLFARYPFNVRPAVDDRPFFSHFMHWRGIPELRRSYGDRELPYLEVGFVLAAVTFVQIVLIALLLIVLPLFRIGWRGARRRWTLLYFAGLGLGFMCFEIVLIQKLVLLLGEPVHATAVVLATLLICSGAGSLGSARLASSGRTLLWTGGLVVGLILLYAVALMPLLGHAMAWPLAAKLIAVGLVLAPPAYFMGMMFPLGLRRLADGNERHIPWACAIDSCLSVAATALATLIALEAGFGAVMLVAAAAYGSALLAAPRLGAHP